MIAVVLAGGKGIRLWPESRRERPKQLCKFVDDKSMLDHTLDRLTSAGSRKIIIITNDELVNNIRTQVQQRSDANMIEILSEPKGKNTAPAVGLVLSRYFDSHSDDVLGIFPADHHVLDIDGFGESVQRAFQAAKNNHLVTIGISPDRPETGYGYIEKTKWEIGELRDVYQVNSFREKPDLSTAQTYLSAGSYMWNAGIYIGKASTFIKEFEKYLPKIHEKLASGFDAYINSYSELPEISLDYGIAEKSERMAVVPANFGWCDLGNWNALAELHQKDNMRNVCNGKDIIVLDSSNCVVKQTKKAVVLFGVEDLLVVETDDVILVSDRNKSQDVRKIVDALQQQQRYDLL